MWMRNLIALLTGRCPVLHLWSLDLALMRRLQGLSHKEEGKSAVRSGEHVLGSVIFFRPFICFCTPLLACYRALPSQRV